MRMVVNILTIICGLSPFAAAMISFIYYRDMYGTSPKWYKIYAGTIVITNIIICALLCLNYNLNLIRG